MHDVQERVDWIRFLCRILVCGRSEFWVQGGQGAGMQQAALVSECRRTLRTVLWL